MREALSVVLMALLLSPAAAAGPQGGGTIKEQVLNITSGTPVEVRLSDAGKLRGRLGVVSDDGFELQTVKDGKINTTKLAFDHVRSIKDTTRKSFGHSVVKALVITGIVVGAIFGIFGIVCAANGGCSN